MNGSSSGSRGGVRLPSAVLFLLLFLIGALGGALVFSWGSRLSGTDRSVGSGDSTGIAGGDSGAGASSAESVPVRAGGEERAAAPATPAARLADDLHASRHNAITRAAARAGRAVVTVVVIQTRLVRGAPRALDPFDLFFNRYLPGPLYEQRIPSMGSGIIVDPEGVVLTNEHVVRGGVEIRVILSDGRELPARLIGSDPRWDLAVLKVEGERLPYAEVGDSDALVVGEWAIAIGNPFGFLLENTEPTVTVGVVSALHRDIKGDEGSPGIYQDMIQTDAAINPGNSGGALVNALGQVIGINTFIFTQGGGSVGMGFAIPINTAVRVARDLMQYGRERQVWIGFWAVSLTPWVARQLGLQDPRGLLVTLVEPGSPAQRAGLKLYDIIREINGRRVSQTEDGQRTIFGVQPGDTINLTVEREGRILRIRVEVVAAPENAP